MQLFNQDLSYDNLKKKLRGALDSLDQKLMVFFKYKESCLAERKSIEDAFPYNPLECADSDGDGLGDNEDPDDNNDGCADTDLCISELLTPNEPGLESV